MPLFEYRAVDLEGNPVEGTMDEVSAQRVTQILKEQGLQVNSVKKAGLRLAMPRMKSRLTWDDIHLLNEQLLAISKSGLPFAPSLKALGQDISNRRLRPVLEDIHTQLESGSSLEEAIGRHPESFPKMYRSMVRAGERTGNLSGVLSHLCTYSARMVEVKNGIQEAVAYPIIVLIAAGAIVGFIMVKVVPVFTEIFTDFGGRLPAMTQLVADISFYLANHWLSFIMWLAVALIALIVGYKSLRSTDEGAYALDWIKIHVPVLGKLYSSASMARFSHSLGLLLASKVPVPESLELASSAAGNAVLRTAVTDATRLIEGGDKISDALESTGRFGHSFCWMVATAEERGDVEPVLLDLADSFERSMARTQRMVLTFIGPFTIILLGLVIGFIVLSLYLPIFTLGDAISG